jgi:hypothetical protein
MIWCGDMPNAVLSQDRNLELTGFPRKAKEPSHGRCGHPLAADMRESPPAEESLRPSAFLEGRLINPRKIRFCDVCCKWDLLSLRSVPVGSLSLPKNPRLRSAARTQFWAQRSRRNAEGRNLCQGQHARTMP